MDKLKKLVAFDMDGTILDGRSIYAIGSKFGFLDQIKEIQKNMTDGRQRTVEIAKLLRGIPASELIGIIQSIGTIQNLQSTFEAIKKQGHVVGIISDSYIPLVNYIVDRFGLDFAVANEIKIDSNGNLTGEVLMPLGWEKIGCYCKNSVCKRFHLETASERFGIPMENTVAIGDTGSDSCMVERANVGIALTPTDEGLESKADVIVREADASKVLPYILD